MSLGDRLHGLLPEPGPRIQLAVLAGVCLVIALGLLGAALAPLEDEDGNA